ncbi:uncharacterized protein TNCV_2850331 [Trichonephila clavipes]|nr:uncharacterized protein TNCV_2850331 [Trichonephila clavipes]
MIGRELSSRRSSSTICATIIMLNTYSSEATEWLATLTAVPLEMGSNPGEDMDVCLCVVPSRHGGTLNSHRAASPLVRLMEEEERWEAPDHFQCILP